MVKLKDLISEWNDTSFKDLPKRWSNTNGLTEFEQQGGKDIVKEYEKNGVDYVILSTLDGFTCKMEKSNVEIIKKSTKTKP